MARSTASMAAACIVSLLLVFAVVSEANVSCGQVASSVSQCLPYIQGRGPVTEPCCKGVQNLNSLAQTTPTRQQACTCLQNLARHIPNLKPALAAGLPSKCGVSVPYPISTSTDCSRVR